MGHLGQTKKAPAHWGRGRPHFLIKSLPKRTGKAYFFPGSLTGGQPNPVSTIKFPHLVG